MSQSSLNTTSAPSTATQTPSRTPLGQTPEASRDQVLSWEAAMGRAEQGAAKPLGGPGASLPAAGEPGGEWSPMNPKGAPAGGEASTMAGAGDAAGARGPMPSPAEPGAQAQEAAMAAALGDPSCAHMSPEELLQRKWDRLAMGLEPDAAASAGGFGDPALLDGPMAQTGSGMAQPITLAQPVALGWQSMPLSERPVVDGMTTEELVTERHVEQEHAEDQVYEANGAAAAEQARLSEVNTPETLPERTIESV